MRVWEVQRTFHTQVTWRRLHVLLVSILIQEISIVRRVPAGTTRTKRQLGPVKASQMGPSHWAGQFLLRYQKGPISTAMAPAFRVAGLGPTEMILPQKFATIAQLDFRLFQMLSCEHHAQRESLELLMDLRVCHVSEADFSHRREVHAASNVLLVCINT